MKSRDQVTFSPTSCRQTNEGSERTLKDIITTQLALFVCEVYLVFQTPFISPPFLLLYSKSNKSVCHKHEGTAKNILFEWSDHTRAIPSTDSKVGNAGLF